MIDHIPYCTLLDTVNDVLDTYILCAEVVTCPLS